MTLVVLLVGLLAAGKISHAAAVNIITNRYDTNRTAANLAETVLTTTNVRPGFFGKLWSYPVEGAIFAQPLYVQHLSMFGLGVHNVLYIATMHDVIYAVDADHPGTPLWMRDFRSLTTPVGVSSWPELGDAMGVLSTPIISLSSNRMFIVATTLEGAQNVYRLHSLDIRSGADTTPATIVQATLGENAIDSVHNIQRAALAIANGQVFISFSGNPHDTRPYHGWVLMYNMNTLRQTSAFATTTSVDGAGVWQSGGGPPLDGSGCVYFLTGNGFTIGNDGISNFSETLLKFTTSPPSNKSLALIDWFTPSNWSYLDSYDLDLSCNAPVLIPGTDLIAFGSKTGDMYVLHKDALGRLQAGDPQVVQSFHVGGNFNYGNRIIGLAYWKRSNASSVLYAWAGYDVLRAFTFNGARFIPAKFGTISGNGEPSMAISVSANGGLSGTGIVWATQTYGGRTVGSAGILRAFNAENPSEELWNSLMNPERDDIGPLAKFVIPVVANGKVYMASSNSPNSPNAAVHVFGVLVPVLKVLATGYPGF